MEDHLAAKIGSIVILGGLSLFFGLIPIKIAEKFSLSDLDEKSKHTKTGLFVTALNSFGAGVILTTCFTHMLPETGEVLEHSEEHGDIDNHHGVALAEILLLVGFLMIYVVEELAHFALDKLRQKRQTKSEDKSGEARAGENIHEELPTDLFANLDEGSFQVAFRGFFIILAISLHAVFEGMAMGLSKKASLIWYLCFAIAAHKFIIAFCVGLQMATSGMKKFLIVIYIGTFSMMTPLGIAIGIALTQTANEEDGAQNVTIAVLHGLAAGTLVYVVFFEILEKERAKKSNGLLQVTFIVLGFIVMILVSLLEGEHHHFEGEEEFCNINPKNIFEQYSSIDSLNVTCKHGAFMIHS